MANFLTPLWIEWLTAEEIAFLKLSTRRAHVRLLKPLLFSVDGRTVEVPAGFVTDFASVPKVFWSVFSPTDPYYSRSAVVHDYGYRLGGWYRLAECAKFLKFADRAEVDHLFLKLMETEGTPWISRRIIHRAVRIFGGSAWQDFTPKGEEVVP